MRVDFSTLHLHYLVQESCNSAQRHLQALGGISQNTIFINHKRFNNAIIVRHVVVHYPSIPLTDAVTAV